MVPYNTFIDNDIFSNIVYGIHLEKSWNISIVSNNITLNGNHGIYVQSSPRNSIEGNNISNNSNGIYLGSSSNNTLKRNEIFSSVWDGIVLASSSDNVVVNNNIYSNIENCTAIISNSNYNTISNNNLSNSSYGIYIDNSNDNNITENNIFDNDNGIEIGSTIDNIVSNNHIHLNRNNGINVGAPYVYVLNNNISNNQNDGIAISNNDWNYIIGNTFFLNNRYGIYLENSPDSIIYHNNFIDNANQAYDILDFANQWDNGYPSGGNYWSDFDEPSEGAYDDYQGSNQNISGRDGIVDNGSLQGGGKNPYIIGPNVKDNYPLMNPYPYSLFLYQGWNLISLPLIQLETNLGIVLSSIKGSYDAVQWYNASDNYDHWKHNSTKKSDKKNDMHGINHTMGFWIHITKPGGVLFVYSGLLPAQNQTITLHPGWNLVGYPSFINRNRTAGLNNLTIDIHVDSIWTYYADTQKYKEVGSLDYFEYGQGYYIHAKAECTWVVPL
jgi:parallel beta-helix repeat protein